MRKPIYQVIESDIKQSILNGNIQADEKIGSETKLAEKYNVSRMTIRKALTNLVNEGYLYRQKGRGTFAVEIGLKQHQVEVRGYSKQMIDQGKKVDNNIGQYKIIEASEEIAKKLLIKKGDKVIFIKRYRYVDNKPMLFENLYVPKSLFSYITPKDFEGSFYKFVEKRAYYKIANSFYEVKALEADNEMAEFFKVDLGSSILFIATLSTLDNGTPFQYVEGFYSSDQYVYLHQSYRY